MPGRGRGPGRQSVSELWSGIVGFSTFGGVFLGVILVGALSDPSAPSWPLLLVGGFVVVWATVPNVVYIRELVRRGAWVPPGTARYPTPMAVALSALLLAVGVAWDVAVVGIAQLFEPALVGPPARVGAIIGAVGFAALGLIRLIVLIWRRSGRTPPGSADRGTTGPSPAAERPPESPL
jgi:hypothetical protein